MSHQMALGHIRHITTSSTRVRYASSTTVRRAKSPKNHGREIYVYSHLQTNQIVYSLTKALNNNASLKQLPFNGKKTVPRALRKDLWSPLAQISFAPGAKEIGLSAFQKLREYRRLHELQWPDSLLRDAEGKIIPKKRRGRQINDQKANSVADIATVLGKIGAPEGKEIGLKQPNKVNPELAQVEVKWANILDAEFAETWSTNVVHDQLEYEKNNRDPQYWAKRWQALEEYKRQGAVTHVEKGKKQKEYWAKMEKEREEWYASQDKLVELKPRKVVQAIEKPSTPLTAAEKQALLEKAKAHQEGYLARVERRNQKIKEQQEKAEKAKAFWAAQDKAREEYYLKQGKSLADMKPRNLDATPLPTPPPPTTLEEPKLFDYEIKEPDLSKAKKAEKRKEFIAAEEKIKEKHLRFIRCASTQRSSEEGLTTEASAEASLLAWRTRKPEPESQPEPETKSFVPIVTEQQISESQPKSTLAKKTEKEAQQQAYWAEQDQKREDWYASKGQTPPPWKARTEKPRKQKVEKSEAQNAIEAQQKEAKKQIAEKQQAYWAEMARKRLEWYASQGKTPPERGTEKITL